MMQIIILHKITRSSCVEVEGIWSGSRRTFVPGCNGLHELLGLDEDMVLRAEPSAFIRGEVHPTRGGSVASEQYGFSFEAR